MNNQNNNYQVVYQEVEEKSLIDLIKLLVKHKIFILTLTIIGFIVGLIGFVIYEKRKPMQMEQKFYLTYMDRMTQMEVAGVPVAPDLAFKDNDFIDMLLDDDYIKKGISSKDNKIRRGYIQGKLSVRQDDPKNNKNFFNNSQKESKYYGNIDTRTVKVGFRFIGKIENIIKDEGQSVKKDEILVQLDNSSLKKSLEEVEININASNIELSKFNI